MTVEVDHAGNPCCGEDFMGGTICSLVPGHDGAHGCDCQVCGGNWMLGTCHCSMECLGCAALHYNPFGSDYCADCCCVVSYCTRQYAHDGAHKIEKPVSAEDVQAAIASIQGVTQ